MRNFQGIILYEHKYLGRDFQIYISVPSNKKIKTAFAKSHSFLFTKTVYLKRFQHNFSWRTERSNQQVKAPVDK